MFLVLFLLFLFNELPLPYIVSITGSYSSLAAAVLIFAASTFRGFVQRRVEKAESLKRKKKRMKSMAHEFNRFLSLFSHSKVDTSVVSDDLARRTEEPYCVSVIKEVVRRIDPNLSINKMNCIVLLWLCYRWNCSRKDPSANVVESFVHLSSFFRATFPSLRFNQGTSEFALAYRNIRLSHEGERISPGRLEDVFRGEIEFKEYKSLIVDFTSNYAEQILFEVLRAQKGEELRAVLTRIIDEGKLSLYGVDRELNLRYQEELLRYAGTTNLVLIFKNLYKGLDKHLGRYPQLQFPAVKPINVPYEGDGNPRIYSRVVKPVNPYPSVDDFVNAEIRPFMTGDNGFIAVLPIDVKNARVLPSQEDFDTKHEVVSHNYRLIGYLLTGRKEPDIALWALITGHITPKVLLSVIPFTLLSEQLTNEEKSTLWEKYDRIKLDFGVEELTDWGRIDPDSLADYLMSEVPGFKRKDRDRVLEISKSIVQEAQAVRAAMIPETYDILAPNESGHQDLE
ncbi:MAG: hypothetical protein LN417_06620 [Candidatus Thermoplasmatota archaeon]|nr:hypothetical protein [Candidatus Thermoplasmatota archaeon]